MPEFADSPNRPIVRLENVGKTFQMGEVAVEALRGVSLEVTAGEFLVMVGPSGSGKTTILNLIGGLDSVTERPRVVRRPRDHGLHARRTDPLPPRHGGLRLPVLQPGAQPHGPRKRDGLDRVEPRADGRRPRPCGWWAWKIGSTIFPRSFPAASSSAWPSPGRWPKTPPCCCATSRPGPWTSPPASGCCERWCDLKQQLGKTVVLITHNAAIAQVADRVVRLRSGQIVEVHANPQPLPPEEVVW